MHIMHPLPTFIGQQNVTSGDVGEVSYEAEETESAGKECRSAGRDQSRHEQSVVA